MSDADGAGGASLTAADLAAAVDDHLLTAEQAETLRRFSTTRSAGASDEEDLRFIRNFHDVFLATGLAMLIVGLGLGAGAVLAQMETERATVWAAAGLFFGSAGVLWILGEYFARRHRLFLPAIVICLGVTGFATAMVAAGYVAAFAPSLDTVMTAEVLIALSLFTRAGPLVLALGAVASAAVFYARFRLPFSIGLTGLSVAIALAAAVFTIAPNLALGASAVISLLSGLGVFAAAVAFDARDPGRMSRFSDNGFWLHFAAAPLIFNGVMGLLFGAGVTGRLLDAGQVAISPLTIAGAVATLIVVAVFAVISLLINRRALLVSGLLSAGVALGVIVRATELSGAALAATTLVLLGATVVLLGAGWRSARRALLFWAPRSGPLARVFPPEAAATRSSRPADPSKTPR